jgi:hypothetical protein
MSRSPKRKRRADSPNIDRSRRTRTKQLEYSFASSCVGGPSLALRAPAYCVAIFLRPAKAIHEPNPINSAANRA